MNEYQRQAYLTSIGVENYMPRWRFIVAPEPVACVLPKIDTQAVAKQEEISRGIEISELSVSAHVSDKPMLVADVLRDLVQVQPKKVNTEILQKNPTLPALSTVPVKTISAFTLSVWRPQADVLVIDSRNTQLALPTELLLQNILRALYSHHGKAGGEEVLRWPLVDNTFVSRTIDDARSVLQVWLEVELERRPVKKLLLLGENATQYFLPPDNQYQALHFQQIEIPHFSAQAIIGPSLVELLQQPMLKRELWKILQLWHSPV